MMTKVLISLLPILIFSIYLFGWRVLALLVIVTFAGVLAEYALMRLINGNKAKVSEAALVSCFLFTLTLPPTIPFWIAIVGIIFGLVFGKAVFGGFGKNIFNPALVGRCLIYVSFPAQMTMSWIKPFSGFPGGFGSFSNSTDAITTATPMILFNKEQITVSYKTLFWGHTAGSIGESAVSLILLAAIYLIVTKTASWKIMLSSLLSFMAFSSILYFSGITSTDPIFSLLSGGFLFALVFMATDPISAPKDDASRIIFGVLIGIIALVIRSFSLFTEGIMFAILITNTFVPLIERNVKLFKKRKKVTA